MASISRVCNNSREKSLTALKIFKNFFNCGRIFENNRYDNHKEKLYRYCVRSITDLQEKIIPFFKKKELQTAKNKDFKNFCKIINLIKKREHLTQKGLIKIAKLIQKMNRKKSSRFLESAETKR